MKTIIKYSSAILFFLLTTNSFSQSEVKEPVAPEPPRYDFEFDFEDFPKMSEEEEKKILETVKEDLKNELKEIKKVNKNKYYDFLRQSQFTSMNIPFLVKREREQHERENKILEAEIKTEALAAKYAAANQPDKVKIKNQLREELNKLFDEKEARRQQEVAQLQNELKELQSSLTARQKNKSLIIERRLQELLEEDEYLDWD